MLSPRGRPPFPHELLPPASKVLQNLQSHFFKPLKLVPFDLQRIFLEQVIKQAYSEAIEDGDFDFLDGHWLRLEVTDVGLAWNMTLGESGPILVASRVKADVTFKGNIKDFIALANQEEDPDTLFFQRRLVIEGDTDLGLAVKNLMYSTELTGFPQTLARALQSFITFLENPSEVLAKITTQLPPPPPFLPKKFIR